MGRPGSRPFIELQKSLGVSHPIDTATDYVIGPLRAAPNKSTLRTALAIYQAAPEKRQKEWTEIIPRRLKRRRFRHRRCARRRIRATGSYSGQHYRAQGDLSALRSCAPVFDQTALSALRSCARCRS